MAETIVGGAFLAADGKTWHNAAGEPLSKEDAAKAQKLHAEQADQIADEETAFQERLANLRQVIVVRETAPAPKAK